MTVVNTLTASQLLHQLLISVGWRNSKSTLSEALPHLSEALSLEDICGALENLKLPFATKRCREREITDQDCPAMVISDDGSCYLALRRVGAYLQVSDSQNPDLRYMGPGGNLCTVIRIDRAVGGHAEQQPATVQKAFQELRPMLPWLLSSSFLSNILGLLPPLLIMAIYDKVIPAGSANLLISLTIGAVLVVVADVAFRHARTKALAYIGWRGERQLMIALFRKLMVLPLAQLQKSEVTQQLSRFRQFEALRDLFTGQVMTALLDLPFVVIFFLVLLYLAPPVAFLSLGLAVFLGLLGFVTIPLQQRLDRDSAVAVAASQSAIQDAIFHQRALINLGMAHRWAQRSQPLVEAAEGAVRRARQFQAFCQSLAQSVTALAITGAIILCAHGAINGSLSFGALIASIALVSKVLMPLQSLYSSFPQVLAYRNSRDQANRVLALHVEMELGLEKTHLKTLTGAIGFSSVTFRPDPLNAPVLSQVSFDCAPGEIVLIMSSDAASRTAVLDLIHGLQSPLAGSIEHDGIDIRQIAKDELRKSVSYSISDDSLFYGTIAQNLRLADIGASDPEIEASLTKMGLSCEAEHFSDGINTRLTDAVLARMSDETLKSLTIARSILRRSSVCLFSEPTNGLSDLKRERFKEWVRAQRGHRTAVISTADRSFIQIADRFIYLNGDRVAVNATGEVGRKKLQAVLKTLGGQS